MNEAEASEMEWIETMKPMKTIVMIPTYNEKENIERLINEILSLKRKIEIVVVDDNSPDGTWKIVESLGRKHPEVHLLLRKTDKGRGRAGIAGFKYALQKGADYVIEMDADFSHHPRYIPALLEGIKDADVVLGSRFVKGGSDVDRGFTRQLITKFANGYIKLMLGLKIKDCTSGYRCFRRKVLESIDLDRMVSIGPAIVQEVLYTAYLKGFKIKEVPIEFRDRRQGQSTLKAGALFNGFSMVAKLKLARLLNKI